MCILVKKYIMFRKHLFLVWFLFAGNGYLLQAQILKPGDTGKTYYDSSFTQVCEIFHHDLRFIFVEDSVHKTKTYQSTLIIKNGPYLSYFPNGKLECSGFYVENERDSVWLYYKPNGDLNRKETYKNDYLIE